MGGVLLCIGFGVLVLPRWDARFTDFNMCECVGLVHCLVCRRTRGFLVCFALGL